MDDAELAIRMLRLERRQQAIEILLSLILARLERAHIGDEPKPEPIDDGT